MVDFKRIICRIDKGYIAIIDKKSPESEKVRMAEFSDATKDVLGLGGWYDIYPLIKPYSWNDYPDDPTPRKTRVFVLVIDHQIIGYVALRWHYHISRHGITLDTQGHPFEGDCYAPRPGARKTGPKPMNFWGVEGICILPEYQHQGFGTLLLSKVLKYLKTNIQEIAFDPPFTNASEALLRHMGLDPKEARLSSSN